MATASVILRSHRFESASAFSAMFSFKLPIAILASALALVSASSMNVYKRYHSTGRKCSGEAKYSVTFYMSWTRAKFGSSVGEDPHLSPLTAFAHKPRYSAFSEYGYATQAVELVAEPGDNMPLVKELQKDSRVGGVGFLMDITPNDGPAHVSFAANGNKGFTHVSGIAMLAPTPDWIVAINNIDICRYGKWARKVVGPLYGYDAGTEKTSGVDQKPQENIYRLQKPRYPQYEKNPIGFYVVKMA